MPRRFAVLTLTAGRVECACAWTGADTGGVFVRARRQVKAGAGLCYYTQATRAKKTARYAWAYGQSVAALVPGNPSAVAGQACVAQQPPQRPAPRTTEAKCTLGSRACRCRLEHRPLGCPPAGCSLAAAWGAWAAPALAAACAAGRLRAAVGGLQADMAQGNAPRPACTRHH